MLYFKCDVDLLTGVSAESFIPKPKVDSTVVRLTPKLPELNPGQLKHLNINEINEKDFKTYSKFVKALFQHRNKKVKNALIDSRHIITDLYKKEMKAKLNSIKQKKIEELLSERITNLTPEEILYLSIHLNSVLEK